jgi:hypothetical protein
MEDVGVSELLKAILIACSAEEKSVKKHIQKSVSSHFLFLFLPLEREEGIRTSLLYCHRFG